MRAPEFWTERSALGDTVSLLLSPLGGLYGLSVRLKRARARPYRAKARVICVGNLTAGGAGKTPVAMAIGRRLSAEGRRVVFLARGYGGRLSGPVQVSLHRHSASDVGDEPLLLAAQGPTVVARNRTEGARFAEALEADDIVMDDGMQNFGLEKDLTLVVIDASTVFGNGRLIPAGPLREPVTDGFGRADALVLMGQGPRLALPFQGSVLRAQLLPAAPGRLVGARLVAFAGIGRPQKFFAMLRDARALLLGTRSFPDHHRFSASELASLKNAAASAGALLVTTEKDYVRIPQALREGIVPIPVEAVFAEDGDLARLLGRSRQPAKAESA